jgi:iron(III) transport system ATP-binding protein
MGSVEVTNLLKKFGNVIAVNHISFEVKDGAFVTILGPSGCGKTSTLRCLAGLEIPEKGRIVIGDKIVYSSDEGVFIPPYKRNIGMMFQSFALWPHMTVFDNIAYGLVERKYSTQQVKQRVKEVIELLNLAGLEHRYPSQLSGGQQQRVALGRALAYPSDLLLLDEPLSNIDAKLRERMKLEIKSLQKKLKITTINVTHNRDEALAMSDEVIIMNAGQIVAHGTPQELFSKPPNSFVADFLGYINPFEGKIVRKTNDTVIIRTNEGLLIECSKRFEIQEGEHVKLFVSPFDIEIFEYSDSNIDGNVWLAEVVNYAHVGELVEYEVQVQDKIIYIKTHQKKPITDNKVKIRVNKNNWILLKY